MEFVEGLNFSQLTEQSGRVQPDQAIDLISQAANGLAEGARRGIIHRDVKPANLLLSREGVVKVADLGLGKMLASRNSNSKDTIVGTALYMSPEQCMGRLDLDHRTDIYALGVTLYQMVTGVTPFTGRSTAEVLLKHASHTPIAPREVVKTLSPALNDLIMEMLAKKPEDRPQNYEILLQRLQECRTGKAKANANGDSLTESSLQSSASRSKARWFGLFGRK
jgi:serine/threonine-protein kinase